MNKIRVLLAEDHTIVRKSLCCLLDGEPGIIEVIGEAEDGRDAVEKVRHLHPDVVLMDITMPDRNGVEATRQIKKLSREVKVVALTMHDAWEYILQALRAGASGYVVKQATPAELVSAIQAAHRGDSFLSPSIAKKVAAQYARHGEAPAEEDSYDGLTDREREVLQLIADGHSNREIAELLRISVKTAETHRAHLMEKLDIHRTAILTQYAVRRGVIGPDQ